jgi:hypothetical protein
MTVFNKASKYCPIRCCTGDVVEIDENIYPAIYILNKKHYHTAFSCSGHVFENTQNSGYIKFDQERIESCFSEYFHNDEELAVINDKVAEYITSKAGNYKNLVPCNIGDGLIPIIYAIFNETTWCDLSITERQDKIFQFINDITDFANNLPSLDCLVKQLK